MKTIIHIGQHKTGTTSIQHYLRSNSRSLAREGLYVPDKIVNIDDPSHFILNIYALDDHRFSPVKESFLQTKPQEFFANLGRELEADIASHYLNAEQKRCKDVIWSNEGLYLLNSVEEYRRLRDLFVPHCSKVVCLCCFREIESYRASYGRQLQSMSITPSSDRDSYRYLEPDSWLFDYDRKVRLLREVFDEVITFSYNAEDIITPFMKQIGYVATATASFRENATR